MVVIKGEDNTIWLTDEEFIKANEKMFIELKTWFRQNKKVILKNPTYTDNYKIYNNHSKTAHSRVNG